MTAPTPAGEDWRYLKIRPEDSHAIGCTAEVRALRERAEIAESRVRNIKDNELTPAIQAAKDAIYESRKAFEQAGKNLERAKKAEAALAQARREALEEAAKFLDDLLPYYSAEFFGEPEPGQHAKSIDGCHARVLRKMLPIWAGEIRRLAEGGE